MLTGWYFSSLLHPLRAGIWVLVPLIGTLALLAGVVTGIIERRRALRVFLFPFLLSECYATIAGFFGGKLSEQTVGVPSWIFLSVQTVLIVYLVYRVRAPRFAPLALAVFSASFALFAWFVGVMAFTGDYL